MSAPRDPDADPRAAATGHDGSAGAGLDMFLLTRAWRDTDDGHTRVELWGATERGVLRVTLPREEPVFFVDRGTPTSAGRRRETELKTRDGADVDAVRFPTRRAMQDEAARLRALARTPYESDVKPSDRFLMERFVTGSARVRGRVVSRGGFDEITSPTSVRGVDAPPPRKLKVAALDIESLGPDVPLMSIAVAAREEERVWLVGPDLDERGALRELVAWITRFDPDVIAGWSVAEFDLAVLERRCERLGVPFTIGRGGDRARVLDGSPPTARVSGRVVLDGPQTLRSATYALESYRLDDVARRFVGRGKAIAKTNDPVAEILRMAKDDPAALAAYNLEDCRLVLDVLDKADLLGFAIERQRLTGLPMDKAGGSVAAFDHLYLPRLHRAGYVAPDVGDGPEAEASPGGFVLESVPGAYEHVLVLDFRSLYPSIIRTWRIDPLGLWRPGEPRVQGFDGATFSRDGAILPELIATLWEARSKARAEGRAAMSTAIKIVMNSFYGVLGTPGCRFFDPRLAASITRRGHEVIGRAQRFIEARGLRVIYGDTDSLFVLARAGATEASASALGEQLADDLNAHFRELVRREHDLESFLEIRFDTHFSRFLMPTLRHSERGTKKRYAGAVTKADGSMEVVIKGLEAVRTDWTPLAREAQRELVRRIFAKEPFEDWLRALAADVRAGKLDDKLVYTKRLRRELDAYGADGAGAPAHVRAARKLAKAGRDVAYVVTTQGPEPVDARTDAPLDHEHYVEKQLGAAADSVLPLVGTSFEKIAGRQLGLFG